MNYTGFGMLLAGIGGFVIGIFATASATLRTRLNQNGIAAPAAECILTCKSAKIHLRKCQKAFLPDFHANRVRVSQETLQWLVGF
jgi:hypothetical protein